jgi:hypothetical protein
MQMSTDRAFPRGHRRHVGTTISPRADPECVRRAGCVRNRGSRRPARRQAGPERGSAHHPHRPAGSASPSLPGAEPGHTTTQRRGSRHSATPPPPPAARDRPRRPQVPVTARNCAASCLRNTAPILQPTVAAQCLYAVEPERSGSTGPGSPQSKAVGAQARALTQPVYAPRSTLAPRRRRAEGR